MVRIDSDTHFTPLDAFADLDLKSEDSRLPDFVKQIGSARLTGGL